MTPYGYSFEPDAIALIKKAKDLVETSIGRDAKVENLSKAILFYNEAKRKCQRDGYEKSSSWCESWIKNYKAYRKWLSAGRGTKGLEDREKAIQLLSEALETVEKLNDKWLLNKFSFRLQLWKGIVYTKLFEIDKAKQCLQAALQKSSNPKDVLYVQACLAECDAWEEVNQKYVISNQAIPFSDTDSVVAKFDRAQKLYAAGGDKTSSLYCSAYSQLFQYFKNPQNNDDLYRNYLNVVKRIEVEDDESLQNVRVKMGLKRRSNDLFSTVQRLQNAPVNINDILSRGENDKVEFKSSMRHPYEPSTARETLEVEIYTTLAAFMNSGGGVLLVGVSNDGKVLGIEKDYETFRKEKNWDVWRRHVLNLINVHIGKETNEFVNMEPVSSEGKTISKISVKENPRGPIFVSLDADHTGEFYIRVDGANLKLNPREALSYIENHWQGRN